MMKLGTGAKHLMFFVGFLENPSWYYNRFQEWGVPDGYTVFIPKQRYFKTWTKWDVDLVTPDITEVAGFSAGACHSWRCAFQLSPIKRMVSVCGYIPRNVSLICQAPARLISVWHTQDRLVPPNKYQRERTISRENIYFDHKHVFTKDDFDVVFNKGLEE